jgi:peroxiredoxin
MGTLGSHWLGEGLVSINALSLRDENALTAGGGGRRNVVLFFMCAFTCSRCWRELVGLARSGDLFKACNTEIQVVGRGRYRRQAAALAAELDLSVTIVDDEDGALRRMARVGRRQTELHSSRAVFVDGEGVVRHRQSAQFPDDLLDASILIDAVARSCVC